MSPVALRLVGAFVAVAFGALAVLVILTLVFARSDIASLSRTQQDDLANSTAAAAAAVYRAQGSWSGADLSAALAPALDFGSSATITDDAGRVVAAVTPYGSRRAGVQRPSTAAVIVDGERVGTIAVQSGPNGPGTADRRLRSALSAAVITSAAFTAAAALVAAVVISRRLVRPVRALIDATRGLSEGRVDTRVGTLRGPGELGELAEAFDTMADALARQDHLRRALVADVAHELRTPLAILQASFEAFVDGVAAPTPEALSSLHDEALRLTSRVEDLEALASAEAAGLSLVRRPLDLANIAGDAVDALAPRFEAAGVTVVRDLQPAAVLGDATRLHQIATNLLVNAAKFTPPGGRVEVITRIGPQGTSELEVRDSGPGLSPDELGHVFERFWRGQQAEGVPGSGIGLAVVQELARAHGGTAAAASGPESGSRFTITLPAVVDPR